MIRQKINLNEMLYNLQDNFDLYTNEHVAAISAYLAKKFCREENEHVQDNIEFDGRMLCREHGTEILRNVGGSMEIERHYCYLRDASEDEEDAFESKDKFFNNSEYLIVRGRSEKSIDKLFDELSEVLGEVSGNSSRQ